MQAVKDKVAFLAIFIASESALLFELREHDKLLASLEKRGAGPQGEGALSYYLAKSRSGGVASQAALRSDLNAVERNLSRALALLDLYEANTSDPDALSAIKNFRAYATSWLEREDALLELYMLGGGYGVSSPRYSGDLKKLLSEE